MQTIDEKKRADDKPEPPKLTRSSSLSDKGVGLSCLPHLLMKERHRAAVCWSVSCSIGPPQAMRSVQG